MEALLTSTAVVAIAEIGDKTQLLAIVLAARFRKPLPIVLGILAATLLNHALAAGFGYLIAQWLTGRTFQIVLGAAFVAMAAWALIPDKEDEGAAQRSAGGVFLTTLVAFFLVEIGDKTQIATSLLAAKFQSVALVTVGTTAGMMLANVPAVFLGEVVTRIVPMKVVRTAAAVVFGVIGLWIILVAPDMPGMTNPSGL
ncbi:MAG: TMEM165/GDT1 family protein [Alphaproteobacteria bacterium]|jgi:putative Ca2+/H+ antiporter (TMEM165/GDT1 family)